MNQRTAKHDMIQQLKNRMGEVAAHRVVRWLEELDKASQRTPKERLLERMEEVTEALATKWLKELDERLSWPKYREEHDDFCYGVAFGEYEKCKPSEERDACTNYHYCKAEHEAEWPERKTT